MTDQTSAAELSRSALVPMGRSLRERKNSEKPAKQTRRYAGRLPDGETAKRIEAYGLANIYDHIVSGETMIDIAKKVGIPESTLRLQMTRDESATAYARARFQSADAWSENGVQYLKDAPGTPAEVNRARALAQECARQAAIRNPRYSERNLVELTGADGGPIQSQVQIMVYLPDNGRGKVVQSDG